MSQTSIFDEILNANANSLVDAINEGRKPKDRYKPHSYVQIGRYVVFSIKKGENILFNCLDINGDVPSGFSACWRSYHHVFEELFPNSK